MQTEVNQKMRKGHFGSPHKALVCGSCFFLGLASKSSLGLHGFMQRNPHYFWGYVSWFCYLQTDFYLIQLLLAAKRRRINKSLENVVRKKARDDTQRIIPTTFHTSGSLAFHSPQICCQTDSSNSRSKIISLILTFFPSHVQFQSLFVYMQHQTHY